MRKHASTGATTEMQPLLPHRQQITNTPSLINIQHTLQPRHANPYIARLKAVGPMLLHDGRPDLAGASSTEKGEYHHPWQKQCTPCQ
jgi:hypothetical protein